MPYLLHCSHSLSTSGSACRLCRLNGEHGPDFQLATVMAREETTSAADVRHCYKIIKPDETRAENAP